MNKATILSYLKYIITGGFSTVIYLSTIVLFVQGFNFSPVVASTFGFVFSLFFGYKVNKHWTFNVKGKSKTYFFKFSSVRVLGFVLTVFLTYIFSDIVKLHYLLAQIFVLGFVITSNYIMTRFWVFKAPEKQVIEILEVQ